MATQTPAVKPSVAQAQTQFNTTVAGFLNTFTKPTNVIVREIKEELDKDRDKIFETIQTKFPGYILRASVIRYENEEIKEEVTIKTEFDIENDVADVQFKISIMVPLLHDKDTSAANNEIKFWDLVSLIYKIKNFGSFQFESIQGAAATEHTVGKGYVYSFTLNGKILLLEEDDECKKQLEELKKQREKQGIVYEKN